MREQATLEREKKNKLKKPNKCYMEVEVPRTGNISEHISITANRHPRCH